MSHEGIENPPEGEIRRPPPSVPTMSMFITSHPVTAWDKYHLHLRCFAAWQLERTKFQT
jgi:hypothetical protein